MSAMLEVCFSFVAHLPGLEKVWKKVSGTNSARPPKGRPHYWLLPTFPTALNILVEIINGKGLQVVDRFVQLTNTSSGNSAITVTLRQYLQVLSVFVL